MKSILSKHLRGKGSSPADPAAPQPASSEPEKQAPKYTPRGGSGKSRILVAVKEGKIDFQAMGSDSAKYFNELMHDPKVQEQFGIGPLTHGFDPKHCKRAWAALGIFFAGVTNRFMKWPVQASICLMYTEAEQEELAKPTAECLDEYGGQWLREHQALAALIAVAGVITQNKLTMAQQVMTDLRKAQMGGQPIPIRPEPAPARVPVEDQTKTNGNATMPAQP